jgi:ABC-type transport system involved in multi-copper enzyme maturation permease subunit
MTMLLSLGKLSVRELWISYQLLLVVALLGLIGLLAPLGAVWIPHLLDPAAPVTATTQSLFWYGISLAGAAALVGLVAARSFAADRLRGTAQWVMAAPISRGSFFGGWMFGMAISVAGGMLLSALTAWFTIGSLGAAPDGTRFIGASVAATMYIFATSTVGLSCGAALGKGRAGMVALLVTAALGAAAWFAGLLPWLPSSAAVHFQRLVVELDGLGMALQLSGASIALMGAAAFVGTVLLERAEL